jgi:hypothetical protein
MAWILVIAIDFLFHAVLLSRFWSQDYPAFKSKLDLFRLIPFGYISFLFLALLVGWIYTRLYGQKGSVKRGLIYGVVFGGFFSLSTFFGWFSTMNLPTLFILLISLVYWIEIVGVGFVFGYLMHPPSIRKRIWGLAALIFLGLILGFVLQNLVTKPPVYERSF